MVVIKAAESLSVLSSELTEGHFSCDMITRIKLDKGVIWLVPLLSLVNPCFFIHNKNYCEQKNENDMCEHAGTVYIMKPINEWSNSCLCPE